MNDRSLPTLTDSQKRALMIKVVKILKRKMAGKSIDVVELKQTLTKLKVFKSKELDSVIDALDNSIDKKTTVSALVPICENLYPGAGSMVLALAGVNTDETPMIGGSEGEIIAQEFNHFNNETLPEMLDLLEILRTED